MVKYLLVAAAAATLSLGLTPLLRRVAARIGALDEPTERKIHTHSIPRLGGVAVALAAALTIAALSVLGLLGAPREHGRFGYWAPVCLGGLIVFAVGLIDDIRQIRPHVKLLCQAAAAGAAIALGVRVGSITILGSTYVLGPLEIPVTFTWIIVMTNAFNLVDGLDGLAGGLAIIAAATCGLILVARGDTAGGTLLAALAGALCGFMPYNLTPATIFLGDAGSLFIGYILGVTAITGFQKGATALAVAVPLLIFALPVAETIVSALRRFLAASPSTDTDRAFLPELNRRLRRVLQADRAHFHHKLVDLGLSARSVVLMLLAISLALALLALVTVDVS